MKTLDKQVLNSQNNILKQIATGNELTVILKSLALEIETLITGTICSILLYNEQNQTLEKGVGPSLADAYNQALAGTKIGPGVGSCGTAAFFMETVIVKDIETDDRWKNYKSLALSYGLKACWSKPIISSEETVLGTFALYYRETREPLKDELELLEVFAHLASIAIEQRNTDKKLYESEKKYRLLAENVSDFVGIIDQKGIFEYASSSHEKYLGYTLRELIGKSILDFVHPDDLRIVKRNLKKVLENLQVITITSRFLHKHGHWVYLQGNCNPIIEEDKVCRFVYMARDITAQKTAEQELNKVLVELESTRQKFHSLYQNSLDAIFELDHNGKLFSVNPAAETLTGYSKEELLRINSTTFIDANSYQELDQIFTAVKQGNGQRVEGVINHKGGHQVIVDINIVPIFKHNTSVSVMAFVKDITDKRKAENEIKELAYKDQLTGLPNRYLFSLKLEEAIKRASETKSTLGVLFIDFDNFKTINDTLGHHVGDLLLQRVVSIMSSCLSEGDVISRQGGDEFLLLIENTSIEDLCSVSERIIQKLKQPTLLAGNEVYITPSIGVSLYPNYGMDAESLIKNADLAMYLAKDMGKNNYQFFTESLNERVIRKGQLENALRRAIDQQEFTLHYQPKIDLDLNRVVGIEALLRWNPIFGSVSPAEFIPITEETGLIVDIGEWVLREACTKNKYWYDLGLLEAPIAVNVSARQFMDPHFIRIVQTVLSETKLPSHLLEIEITERVMINVNEASDIINQLREMGIQITIDDFGIGYSSLSMINSIDIDNLKIDQSFLHDVMKNKKSSGLLGAIIQMGREIEANVVIEGIETEEQASFLAAKGLIGQGYHFSYPLPEEKFEKYLAKQEA
ncbi:EAL domain-containing protein [Anaerobacillus alkaliphilus]|uniref:EAL domain-containing protein n=1 Tax=Anaerobacillus alkaliphilus TaxID=1548597 RepID=A0A4Q0VMU8_9BACI|nr:EAL domain-containing protein [Anaerobacillus alkaliphilus]RXI96150.1 EAL domain-containing protein [Anaerobacillus alkaliphilus]